MIDWWRWHALMWSLRFGSWFGVLKRKANDDVNASYSNTDSVADGAPLDNEAEYASRFHELGRLSLNRVRKLDMLIPLTLFVMAALAVQWIQGFGDILTNYIALGTLAVLAVLLALIVYVSTRKSTDGVTENDYKDAGEWLPLMSEEDRRPMGVGHWLFLVLALGLESVVIGKVVASAATAQSISENMADVLGVFLGVAVAALLASMSHAAGEKWYRANKRRIVKATVSREKKKRDGESPLLEKFEKHDNNFESGFLSGIKFHQKYGMLAIALGLSIIIGSLAFVERKNLNWDVIYGDGGASFSAAPADFSAAPTDLPSAVVKGMQKTQDSLDEASKEHEMQGAYAALAILFLLLLGMNALGIWFSYHHSFAHDKSKNSYRKVRAYERNRELGRQVTAGHLLGREAAIRAANRFFKKYHATLIKKAGEQGESDLQSVLNQRKAYRMERYLKEHASGEVGDAA